MAQSNRWGDARTHLTHTQEQCSIFCEVHELGRQRTQVPIIEGGEFPVKVATIQLSSTESVVFNSQVCCHTLMRQEVERHHRNGGIRVDGGAMVWTAEFRFEVKVWS